MKASLAALKPWVSGATITADAQFDGISTNSKTVARGNLFVALRGERFDAHAFLDEVTAAGAAAVVVDHLPPGLKVPALLVPDTKVALGEIASYWRRQFSIPVIGVTGSNGKTTVKEMLASILAAEFGNEQYLATRGNLNNDIGVPLTLARMNVSHRAAVIELGMNHPGEIATLSGIAQPTVGLVNNAQREHQEFMESVEAVAKENGSVINSLPAHGVAVFPADDPFSSLWRNYAKSGQRKVMTFGLSPDANVSCTFQPKAFGSDLLVKVNQKEFAVSLSAAGIHNVRNALAAIACSLAIGVHRTAIVQGLESFSPVAGRLQRKAAQNNGALVIDDTYNANPDSVRAAIDVLAQSPAPRLLVLGDMGEVGSEGRQFHTEVGAYARGRGIEHLFTLGELAAHANQAFGTRAKHFNNIDELNQAVEKIITPQATVLIKGSRFMKMERVVQHLTGEQAKGTH